MRRTSLSIGRQLAGPFPSLRSGRLTAMSTSTTGLRLPVNGQQITPVPTDRRRPTRLLHRLQRHSSSNQGQYQELFASTFLSSWHLLTAPKTHSRIYTMEHKKPCVGRPDKTRTLYFLGPPGQVSGKDFFLLRNE